MNWNEYVSEAVKTLPQDLKGVSIPQHMIMGITGELGEVVDVWKKDKVYGNRQPDKMVKEMGDVLWYCAGLHYYASLTNPEINESWIAMNDVKIEEPFLGSEDLKDIEDGHPKFDERLYSVINLIADVNKQCSSLLLRDLANNILETHSSSYFYIIYKVHQIFLFIKTQPGYEFITFEMIYETNIAKLRERYAAGFTQKEAIERRDV